jgi:SAM-dependent methyltransferase
MNNLDPFAALSAPEGNDMSGHANTRIEEIVSEIRAKISQRTNDNCDESAQPPNSKSQRMSDPPVYTAQAKNALAVLGRLDDAIGQAGSRIGSCPPSPPTVRGRLGAAVIEQLSKLLWWQSLQVRETVNLLVRRNREQTASTELAVNATNRIAYELTSLRNWIESELGDLRRLAAELPVLISRIESANITSAELKSEIAAVSAMQIELKNTRDAEVGRMNDSLSSLSGKISDLGLAAHRLRVDVSAQQARIGHLVRELRVHQPVTAAPQQPANDTRDESLDRLYVDFEGIFRGPREQIRERQKIYLPVLRSAGIEGPGNPVLDLGCGRGEWLEELRQHGIEARGADTNRAMLEDCRKLGLNVVEGDALQHLASLPDGSEAAITSFHMIEHMSFQNVIMLLDQALRVLRPGGLLILETPNPGNLAVGASTFYLDPTHVRPIPSPLLQFAAEARGFCDSQIMELHPYPESVRLPDETAVGRRFNECIYGPQDYALVARKP